MSNTTGSNTYTLDEAKEFKAYDALPKAFRRALANSAFKWSAALLREIRNSSYLPATEASRFIAEQEDHMIASQANEIWGKDYLRHARPDLISRRKSI